MVWYYIGEGSGQYSKEHTGCSDAKYGLPKARSL